MKLWILRPIHTKGDDPWNPWYDKSFGFVVVASSEIRARQLAHGDAGDENMAAPSPWLDPKYSTCIELVPGNEEEIIMCDFASA